MSAVRMATRATYGDGPWTPFWLVWSIAWIAMSGAA
jgi:hypothetical protein